MKPLNKKDLEAKAQSVLSQYKRSEILATEDGNVFWPENKAYADQRARDLMKIEGFSGEVATIKASTKAPKAESKPEPEAPKAEAPTKAPKKGGKKGK